ncbi:MAG: hypothetical protein HWD61_08175 [Parachlamydiaceae bacterium]|nr:MAG: hypothetical protein HWD61_08175 [Parachlamydiaceae bacterium]
MQGHHLFVTSNQKTLWITRLAAAVILALGVTLIAALTTAGAIAGGVVCILTATAIILYTIAMPHFREKFHEFSYLSEMKKNFDLKKSLIFQRFKLA